MLTIHGFFGYDLPMKEGYRLIRQVGFGGVLIWWGDDFGDADYQTFPDLARSEGLYVENLHAPFAGSSSIWLDNLDGEAVFDRYMGCIEACHTNSVPTVIMHLMTGTAPPACGSIGLDRLRRLVEKAEQKGVVIALENLRRADFLQYVFDHINSEHLGFCFDSGHKNCFTPETDVLSHYGSRLAALHLHDNDGSDDQHKLPFDGTVDWRDTMKKIAGTGYTGPTALEVGWDYTVKYPNPEDFLKAAYERARRLEDMR